ncbi:TonB-linked outer membrane protein, SusC/RagA family [Catalinimonas alkaloidigena]|uniref:TonB-linked outer membrane protein, SusC/RagA family n=1 Tax=Catalinimonas alkaloidigena TaxID=1075417 RepID=A0A1G9J040_9BACT|nr:SusC/RagA family TonB-linked outer membrane protein [Catalinimonas alkaloidigena]SDL30691.1 TonB-linked outer membrane protein, SusC/RagA family [Catalinimonas alkaloidigena]
MKNRLRYSLLFLWMLPLAFAHAQTVVSGQVTDSENNQGIPGVNVLIKGTSNGTITDLDGHYQLTASSEDDVLVFSFIGYESQEVRIGNQSTLNVALDPSLTSLNEVIIVGYDDKKESELTSSVTTVSARQLKDVTTNNVGSMLQGKVAGLQVVNSSGVPGAAPEIRLRGVSSINASQSPLFVVDGIIGGNYDPNDVESITVLKDAAATAMYGSQANAGVIIVTTKRAAAGKTRFDGKVTVGVRTPYFGTMEMMNGSQLYNYQKEFYRDYNTAVTDNSYKIDLLKFYSERPRTLRDQDFDWLRTIFGPAPVQNYYFSASGNTEKHDYYVGMSYYREKGTFLNTDYQRLNLRGNSTYHFSDAISLTNNVNVSANLGKSYDYMDIYYAYLNLPWDNPYDSLGHPVYVDGNSSFRWWSRDKVNPLHTINNSTHTYKGGDVNYDLNLNVDITPWLTFASTNRAAIGFSKGHNFFSPLVAGQYHGTGYLAEDVSLNYGGVSNQLLKFNFQLGDHNLNGLAGVAFQGGRYETLGLAGRGLPQGLQTPNVISSNQVVSGNYQKDILQSFISQVNYMYQEKYFLTGSYRIDGSSAFPPTNRSAGFPAVSAAWLMSKEAFLQNSNLIDNLKLRLSYGVTGTQDIGASRYLGLFALTSQYNSMVGAIPLQLPSPNLTWESKYQWNAGIDLGLARRVSLTADVYHNATRNLLLQVSQPLSVGFEQRWDNVGEVINKGVELGLAVTPVQTPAFAWNADFNINVNSNRLQGLPSDIIRTGSWGISQIYRNGGNLYEFYIPKWLGVDSQTGAPLWEEVLTDEAGNVTGRQPTSDYAKATPQEVGSALPKFQGGFNNTFSYKGLSLRVNTYFLSGNKVFSNNLRFVLNDGHEPYYNQMVLPEGRSIWTQPGDQATEPSPQNAANSTETSSRYLMDGSYFTIRNVALSYEIPKAFVERLKLQSLVVSLTADNVYTFTNFVGQDPQTTITPNVYTTPGVSDFKYPNNQQFLFNLLFSF